MSETEKLEHKRALINKLLEHASQDEHDTILLYLQDRQAGSSVTMEIDGTEAQVQTRHLGR